MKYKADLELIDAKRVKGETMLQGLTSERIRWTENEK